MAPWQRGGRGWLLAFGAMVRRHTRLRRAHAPCDKECESHTCHGSRRKRSRNAERRNAPDVPSRVSTFGFTA